MIFFWSASQLGVEFVSCCGFACGLCAVTVLVEELEVVVAVVIALDDVVHFGAGTVTPGVMSGGFAPVVSPSLDTGGYGGPVFGESVSAV
jgi:hypothetical protein